MTGTVTSFAFGDAEPAIGARELWQYFEVWNNGQWYEPPVPPKALAQAMRMASYHESAIRLKLAMLASTFVATRWLDRANFKRAALDYLVTGNLFFEERRNLAGRPARLIASPAVQTRVGVKDGEYWFASGLPLAGTFKFETPVHHLKEPDMLQEIYGVPGYLAALQAGLLNEAATVFRRRYYLNGSHAGFVFYNASDKISNDDSDAIRQAMRDAKGPGNFKNLYIHAPGGKKEDIQILPISEVAARDEFMGIKNVTRDDLLAAHRTPPQLLGIIPTNNAGFGDPRTAMAIFYDNEIEPIWQELETLNDAISVAAIARRPYTPPSAPPPAP